MPNTDFIFDKGQNGGSRSAGEARSVQKKGKVFFLIALLAVIAVAGGFFYLLAPKTGAAAFTLKAWTEAAVSAATVKNTVSSTGVIELTNKETILAPQTSQVSAVYVAEGDTVPKGKALVRLASDTLEWSLVVSQASYDKAVRDAAMTDTEYEFSIRQQDINIKTAERNLKTAREKLVQTQGLLERDIASASELTAAENSVADTSDSLELAKLIREQTAAKQKIALTNRVAEFAQLKKAVTDLQDSIAACTIRSESAGRVYSLSVAVGDRVSAYSPVAVIANPSDLQVGIDVAENRINEVKVGNPVTITIGDAAVQGRVKSIASSATTSSSSSTSTIRVVSGFNSVPAGAIVGGSVSADIQVGLIENAMTLPRGAYLSSGNYLSAYVIGDGNAAVKKAVTFGITDGNAIQVVSGLSVGDRVITSAYQEFIHLDSISLAK